jgi:NADH-quinone oxidoreductase subunit K
MNLDGHIFGLLVIVLAAAEAAVALAIIINIYNNMNTINVDEAAELKR